ncbi:MAG: hypothetical protein LKJ22_02675 [Liquorilactobacillus nagelii]|mgnify:CR=1 FL=1|jgi:hypothetical protein|uniref:hypothetical protein n=1 Tax=Liquorilactobacillus nagelii TaxID=82688 RepID=UPI002431F4F3|nr:hypothetical protein [Liquorilactobacillus nagelii]MCI1920813.1 hypothetical protein [Liquorilactobacillus nagelii]MCI1976855.1 hypothetical protein [Liquorilactobacillus nagelii]
MNLKTKKAIQQLDKIGAVIMIGALFVGNFYAGDPGGGYMYSLAYPGYKLIFNSDYLLGTLFIVIPVILLIIDQIKAAASYCSLIKLILAGCSLIFLFVLKGQLADTGNYGGSATFASGAWIFLVGNILALIGAAATYCKIDLVTKIEGMMHK